MTKSRKVQLISITVVILCILCSYGIFIYVNKDSNNKDAKAASFTEETKTDDVKCSDTKPTPSKEIPKADDIKDSDSKPAPAAEGSKTDNTTGSDTNAIPFTEELKAEDAKGLDTKEIANRLLSLNLEALKDERFSNVDGCSNKRIKNYEIKEALIQEINDTLFYMRATYSVEAYDINCYLVGRGAVDGDWKTETMFYVVKKVNDVYKFTSRGTGPSEEMLNGEFK